LDAFYMLTYDEELIDTIACPLFGPVRVSVGRSPHARHFRVPNAALGAGGYAAMAVLVLWEGGRPASRRGWKPGFLGAAGAAVAVSAFLTWEETRLGRPATTEEGGADGAPTKTETEA
jgi:hypothetical protein